MKQAINIIFDGPPSHEAGRFVEVELDNGKSISVGKWVNRGDGYWALRINELPGPSNQKVTVDTKPCKECAPVKLWHRSYKFCPYCKRALSD
jgi:hypothetical protein